MQPLHPPPRSASAPDVVTVHVTHVSDGPNPLRKPFIGKDFFWRGKVGHTQHGYSLCPVSTKDTLVENTIETT